MINEIEEMLKGSHENEDIFYEVTDFLLEKEIEKGFNSLNESEKYLFMVGKMLMEVNNGGFDQYFLNTEGVYSKDTLHFLNFIDETNFSSLLYKAIKIFEMNISDDVKYDKLDELDNEFYEFDTKQYDSLYEKCVSYIKNSLKNS